MNERENEIETGTVIGIATVQTGIKIVHPKSDEQDQIIKNHTRTPPRPILTLDNSRFNPVGRSLLNLHHPRIKWMMGNWS